MYRNRMTNYYVLLVYTICFIGYGEGTCTFPITGTWHSSNYDSMEFSGSGLHISGLTFARTSVVGSGWECYLNTGNKYVTKTNITITLNTGGAAHYAYTCFVFTSVNSYSYYYYQNTPVESLLGNERIVAYAVANTVTADDVCSDVPSAAEYNVIVQSGQELNAKTNIGEVMFANFHYLFHDGVSDECGTGASQSLLTICTDRQTLTFDYSKCSDLMMYSSGGVLGSVATIVSGTTYYTTVYNFDSSVDGVDTFRFTCIAAAVSGSHLSATILPKSCTASQSPTIRPASGGIFTLVANSTCAITPTVDSDGVDLAAIIGGIIGAIILIVLIAILLCIRHHKIKRRKQEIIDKRMKIWKIRSTEDDFYDDDFLNETSMKLDCSQSENPEAPVLEISSSGTKLSQKNQKDPTETDSFTTHLEQQLENPMREKSFHVETHRNKDKISDLLAAPGKRTELMPWRTGKSSRNKGYSLEGGFQPLSKPGSLTSRSYTTLQSKQNAASSEFGSMYTKNRKYSRSALNLSRSQTASRNHFESDSNIYAKVKAVTEKSLSRELTAIKEVPRKATPNYMKPVRSKTSISIKDRAKSRQSVSRHFNSNSRALKPVNKSRMNQDCIPANTKVSRKTKTPREQVMLRAKSKMVRENTKLWRVTERMMPNPTPADEKSFVQSLRDTYPPLKKKKPKNAIVKKLKTPYGIVHIDVSKKRTTSIMSLDHLRGLVHVERRKVPSRSQVDVIHQANRSKTMIVDGTWIGHGVGTDAQKGATKSTDSEYFSSMDELL